MVQSTRVTGALRELTEQPPEYWPVPLPEYDRPPVVETVMAVQFARLRRLSSVEILDFWRDQLKVEYPIAVERPAYQVPIETFGRADGQLQVQMELTPAPERIRYWFQSESNEILVQLQNDWLALNWRKVSSTSGYRRYSFGAKRFAALYDALDKFCRDRDVGRLAPQQVEISYINLIVSELDGWQQHSELGRILKPVRPDPALEHLPEAQAVAWSAQFPVGSASSPLGRLHADAQPTVQDDRPSFSLQLTYRGRPEGDDLAGVTTALDRGHHWIVGGFDALTTAEMHTLWGRKDRHG